MVKFTKQPKLSSKEIQAIIMDLCAAIASVHDTKEAAQLLTDLLGKQELEMIAKRLKIAELLLRGETYQSINRSLKVSFGTIARVQLWLGESGEGYRFAVERSKSKRKNLSNADEPVRLSAMKRRYPLYFWPQILMVHWAKHASKKEKEKMKLVLEKLGNKRKLYKELDTLLSSKE
jgi:uncharacterized protein YerC